MTEFCIAGIFPGGGGGGGGGGNFVDARICSNSWMLGFVVIRGCSDL